MISVAEFDWLGSINWQLLFDNDAEDQNLLIFCHFRLIFSEMDKFTEAKRLKIVNFGKKEFEKKKIFYFLIFW